MTKGDGNSLVVVVDIHFRGFRILAICVKVVFASGKQNFFPIGATFKMH